MDKKKIVLISPTNPDPPPNYFGPPFGLSLISACLLVDKRPVGAYDFDLEPQSVMLSSMGEIINKDRPKYIGICIQSCNRGPVYELIKTIKEIDKSIIIILGGPFASLKYELLLRNFPVDYVVIGDGERTLVELLNCLENGGDPKKVNSISFLLDNHLYITEERRKETNLDLLPYPAFHLFKDFDKKINAVEKEEIPNFILGRRCTTLKNALLLLSSRGCIYNCNFCPMSGISKDKIRFHSPEYFVNMVEYFYQKYKIKNYIFGDNTFTLVKDRVIKICDEINKRRLKIKWSCMTRSDYIDSELLKKMARAGCFEISYGVESGSPKIQSIIRKNLDLTLTKKAFKMTKDAGIRSILMLMVGNLGETEYTIRETLSYVQDIDPDNVLVKILKVYPGTEIHDIFERKGLLKKDYYLSSEFTPSSFTLQHSERELKSFSQMIGTRRIYIQISNVCNNNCIFCYLNKKANDKDFKEIKKELILASTRGEHIILCGGEPFLRKDIFQILAYADKLEIHHLCIYSNARIFFYKVLAKKIGETKLRKIIIPFFGLPDIHNQIVRIEGAFSQSVEGIKNLREFAPNLKIQVKIFILDSNYKSLFELTQFLSNLGVDEFGFVFAKDLVNLIKVKTTNLPLVSSVMPRLKKLAIFLKQSNKVFYFEGLPQCSLETFKKYLDRFYYPFNEMVTLPRRVVNLRRERERGKEKFSFCLKCEENKLCEGIWKGYSQVYGISKRKSF